MGLVNGAMGTVQSICYHEDGAPPDISVAVTVLIEKYSGPMVLCLSTATLFMGHMW